MKKSKSLHPHQQQELLNKLKARFELNMVRHPHLEWADVLPTLESNPTKLWSLNEMERTGGEPDILSNDTKITALTFLDCSLESPSGRRSICYDRDGLDSRKEHKPMHNAVDMASEMGIELLTESDYRKLQEFGDFDTKTSSWLKTPQDIREFGGAIFGDFRYGKTFVYHNGAQSYYAARGFRGLIRF